MVWKRMAGKALLNEALAFFRVHFATEEDCEDEARKKIIFAALGLATSCAAGINIVLVHTVPFLMFDLSLPQYQILDSMLFGWVLLTAWAVLHLYIFGLTTFLKVTFLSIFSMMILACDVFFDKQAWHVCIVVLLNGCLLLESEHDAHIMWKLSILIRAVTVVYVGLRALGNGCVIPSIHPFENNPRSDGQCLPELVCIEFLNTTFPLMLNFWFVQYYAGSARHNEQKVMQSVDLAAKVAQCLVNYDLDMAGGLLVQADTESPIVSPLFGLLRNLRSYRSFLPDALFSKDSHAEPPNLLIKEAMSGKKTSWEHALTAVLRLRDPLYTLGFFQQDIMRAFPELELYDADGGIGCSSLSSGRTGHHELQRTMGAFYAVYCMARLDLDGREVFTYGVDEQWVARTQPHGKNAEKMASFMKSMDWEEMVNLMLRANLLIAKGGSGAPCWLSRRGDENSQWNSTAESMSVSSPSSSHGTGTRRWLRLIRMNGDRQEKASEKPKFTVNVERMTAMLVLTAVHDIMKNKDLLPTVKKMHAPYNGVDEDVEITDHDLALAYIMEHFPNLLPSYSCLEPGQRAPVLFTQGKMCFNNGWLVQGEAPPGALFSTFKRVIQQGGASESDISFYFVHWLTDLAGAETFDDVPWPGSEKFVSKFPLRVLNAFLESFGFVDRLAVETEVEVMEEYLQNRWSSLGPPESGEGLSDGQNICAMRLALMAQGFETEVVDAFLSIRSSDQDVIADEMARTGCRQQFQGAPSRLRTQPSGPAMLVYYAPALLQKAGPSQVELALSVLASIYRAGRDLFPLECGSGAEKTVTVRIDKLKVLTPTEICTQGLWHVKKVSDGDAEVVPGPPPDEAPDNCVPLVLAVTEFILDMGSNLV